MGHRVRNLCTYGCIVVGVGVNMRKHVLEMIFLYTCNRRCVVYESVTNSQAELEKLPAPFQPRATFNCLVPFLVKVGVCDRDGVGWDI